MKNKLNTMTLLLLSSSALFGCHSGTSASTSSAGGSSTVTNNSAIDNTQKPFEVKYQQSLDSGDLESKVYEYEESATSRHKKTYRMILSMDRKVLTVGGATFTLQNDGNLVARNSAKEITWSAKDGDMLGSDLSNVKCYALRSESNLIDSTDIQWQKDRSQNNGTKPEKYTNSIRLVGLNDCINPSESKEVLSTDNIGAFSGTQKLVFTSDGNLTAYNKESQPTESGIIPDKNAHFIFNPGMAFVVSDNNYLTLDYQTRYLSAKIAKALELDQGEEGEDGKVYSSFLYCNSNNSLNTPSEFYRNYFNSVTACTLDSDGKITNDRIELNAAKQLIPMYLALSNTPSDKTNIRYGAKFDPNNSTITTFNKVNGQDINTMNLEGIGQSDEVNDTDQPRSMNASSISRTVTDTSTYAHTFNFSNTDTVTVGAKYTWTAKEKAALFFEGQSSSEVSWSFATAFTQGYSDQSTKSTQLTYTVTIPTQAVVLPPYSKLSASYYLQKASFNAITFTSVPILGETEGNSFKDKKHWLSIYAVENPNIYGFNEIQLNRIDMRVLLDIMNKNKFNATYSGVGSDFYNSPSIIDFGSSVMVGGDYAYEIIEVTNLKTGTLMSSTIKELPTTGPQALKFSHIHDGKHVSGKGTFGSANTMHHAHHN